MDWTLVRAGFEDELTKIAEVSLRGLSPESTMQGSIPPPPMESQGFQKARDILGMASQVKTASARKAAIRSVQPGLGKLTHQGDDSAPEAAKSVAGYGLAGAGTAGTAHKFHQLNDFASLNHPNRAKAYAAGAKSARLGARMMAGGAAVGAAYGGYRALKKRQAAQQVKVSTVLSPGAAKRAAGQVGRFKQGLPGPGIKKQISGTLIGHKGGI